MTSTHLTPKCPVCLGQSWRPDPMADRILGLVDPYHVQACSGCGLHALTPQLGAEDLQKLYAQGYFSSAVSETSAETAWEAPERDYMSEVIPERSAKFSQTLRDLKRLFPEGKSFLDVGAATGDMVNLARGAGLAAEGLEFSEFAVRQAKQRFGIDLMQVPLAELDGQARYDLIHLNHVFEHFNDPTAELQHLKRLLKPNGGLYIEVPLQFHFVERLRTRWRSLEPGFSLHSLHHPYFYTVATMRRLLQNNGFDIRSARVFDAARYPSDTPVQRVKKLLWRALATVDVGNFVEVIATPRSAAR